MALYQSRQRDPLFDSTTQAALEKRGKELIGLFLILLAAIVALMLSSYSPDDPSWVTASDTPVQNAMGRTGASISASLIAIIGLGSWGLAIIMGAWGLRMVLHRGEERALERLIFFPIAIAFGSVYAASLTPGSDWSHSFGLGGLFGETVLGVILTIIPFKVTFGVKLMSLVMGVGILAMGTFVLGFTMRELKVGGRFMALGVVMLYSMLLQMLGQGASASMRAAQGMQANIADRREKARAERAEAEAEAMAYDAVPEPTETQRVANIVRANMAAQSAPVAQTETHDYAPMQAELRAEPNVYHTEAEPESEPRGGLLSRMPSLLKRADPLPAPELVEPELIETDMPAASDDRIKAKISDVIKARVRSPMVTKPQATLLRKRGPQPLILDTSNPQAGLPAEPQLYADPAMAQAPLVEAPMVDVPAFEAPLAQESIPQDVAPQPAPTPSPVAYDLAPKPAVTPVTAPAQTAYSGLDRRVVQHPVKKPIQPSVQAKAEAQPALQFEDRDTSYEVPPLSLLANPAEVERHVLSDEALEENARMLETVLDDYGVKGEIVSVRPGPVVTMYELEPAPGLKASRVIGLADDIARSMSALSARVSTVPGRSVIGIELPNEKREMVSFREILSNRDYGDGSHKLPLALGKDIGGDPVVANLAKMPHLLIAGTTGSGKSVAINTMILSLLYKLTPDECRMIMIDPKMLELSVYDGIPHLLSPVVTDPKKAVVALKWTVGEMEDRYRKMSKMGVRNIEGYNGRVADALAKNETFSRTVQTGFADDTGEPIFETEEIMPEKMPYIVVIVDEMADLMMVAGKEIEACIQRLAQMARASGIHIIMATQRPSVDVITGTIKANFPTRISFQVTGKIDSRTILGEQGAEQLLGMGDMLYMAGGAKITRVHGPFVSDEEVEEIVTYLKQFGPPDYQSGVVDGPSDEKESNIDAVLGLGGNTTGEDALYDQAVQIVARDRKCSTSYIQRKLAIGYNKAARLVEQMEDEGVVSSANHVGKRDVLVPEIQ